MMASTEWPPRGEAGGPPGPAEPLQEQHPEGAEEHEHEFDSASTRTTCTCRWSRSTPAGLGPFLDGSGKDRTDSNQPWAGIYLFSSQARRRARAAWLTPETVLAPPARHAPPPLMRSPEKFGVRGIHLPRLAWARLEGRRVLPHLRVLYLGRHLALLSDKTSGEACSSTSTSSSVRSSTPSACSRRSSRTLAVRRRSNRTRLRGVVFYIYAFVSAILVAVCVQSAMLKETSATFRSLAHARSTSGHPCR